MDMTVNRLPARTWNWLDMNETVSFQRRAVSGWREIPGGKRFPANENETEHGRFCERLKPVWGRIWMAGRKQRRSRHRFRGRKYDGLRR